jgi:hypothetical protein
MVISHSYVSLPEGIHITIMVHYGNTMIMAFPQLVAFPSQAAASRRAHLRNSFDAMIHMNDMMGDCFGHDTVDGKAETQYPIQKHSLYCFTT